MGVEAGTARTVGVVGAGFIGGAVAQVCAQAGFTVTLVDIKDGVLTRARERILRSLEKLSGKAELAEAPAVIFGRISLSLDPPDGWSPDFIIECVPEDFATKESVFAKYGHFCAARTIIGSNTSAIPIGKMAGVSGRPDRFIGMHFASPPTTQRLVEMIPCLSTSAETIARTGNFLRSLGLEVVEVKKDTAGFIMSRIYLSAAGTAMRLLELGAATASEIDQAMRVGFGWVKGPLEAADFAGLDVIRGAMLSIWEDTKDPGYWPPDVLTRLVNAGRLGRKTGWGFYKGEWGHGKG
ncbi:MAG: 3-hydroxyacyl-CoA dehydrogenase family protein [Acidobacteriota bacterium]